MTVVTAQEPFKSQNHRDTFNPSLLNTFNTQGTAISLFKQSIWVKIVV
jgi:hypothetical protein